MINESWGISNLKERNEENSMLSNAFSPRIECKALHNIELNVIHAMFWMKSRNLALRSSFLDLNVSAQT